MKLILKAQEWMSKLIHREDGVTAIEYGLIAALIAVTIIATVDQVGDKLLLVFQAIRDRLVVPPA